MAEENKKKTTTRKKKVEEKPVEQPQQTTMTNATDATKYDGNNEYVYATTSSTTATT